MTICVLHLRVRKSAGVHGTVDGGTGYGGEFYFRSSMAALGGGTLMELAFRVVQASIQREGSYWRQFSASSALWTRWYAR